MDEWNGKFEMVDPTLIVVDHRYQRPEKEVLIGKIAKNPNWAAFGALSLYRRDGVLVCVDGQQRLRGVLSSENPPKLVPAVIQDTATLAQEAQTFVDMNITRTAVQALEKHHGLVAAENPAALAIERAVATAGYSLGGGSAANNIQAVSTLYYVYNMLGEDGLVQVLSQARDSWPNDPAGVNVNMLRVICDVITEQGSDYHRGKLTTALAKSTPADILRKASALMFDLGGSKQVNVRRAVKALCKI